MKWNFTKHCTVLQSPGQMSQCMWWCICSKVWIWKVVVVHGSESQLEVQWSITARLPPSFRKQSYVHVTISDQLQSAENLAACEMIMPQQVWHSCPMSGGVLNNIQPCSQPFLIGPLCVKFSRNNEWAQNLSCTRSSSIVLSPCNRMMMMVMLHWS